MNRRIKIITAVILAVVLFFSGYLAYKKYFNKPALLPEITSQTSESGTPTSTIAGFSAQGPLRSEASGPALGWKLYKNADFGFEIQYPDSWTVSEEDIINVRDENTKGFFFKKPNSDLRFAILPRDGLSYGLPNNGASSEIFIGGSVGAQNKWTLPDGRRLWLIHPQYGLYNWLEDIGRIDIQSSATDSVGDTIIFEKMLNSFKLNH